MHITVSKQIENSKKNVLKMLENCLISNPPYCTPADDYNQINYSKLSLSQY